MNNIAFRTALTYIGITLLFATISDGGECNPCVLAKCSPTIEAAAEFDASADVKTLVWSMSCPFVLRKKEKVIALLTSRSESQRNAIRHKYRQETGRDLKRDLRPRTHFTFGKLIRALATPLPRFYAKVLKRAIKNKDVITMTEIFTSLSPCFVKEISKSYEEIFGIKSLENDIKYALRNIYSENDFTVVLLSLSRGERDTDVNVNKGKAKKDAEQMEKAVLQDLWKLKADAFSEVFTKRSIPQLSETIKAYEERGKKRKEKDFISLETDLEKKFESVKEIYIPIVELIKDQPFYFAKKLEALLSKDEMSREDKKQLMYIVSGRCDVDLGNIRNMFQTKFKKSIYTIIKSNERSHRPFYTTLLKMIKY